MPTVLITGGTGFVGQALTRALTEKGYEVVILTRNLKDTKPNEKVAYAEWNIQDQFIDRNAIAGADYIVHLAGAGIADKRWSKKYKNEIVESRVKSSELLVQALQQNDHKVRAVVSASAIGWYGQDKFAGHSFEETEPADPGFLGVTCAAWEHAIEKAAATVPRVVKLRTGLVLGNGGGALAEFMKPLKWGIAPILGTGKQVMSWIELEDLSRMYIHALEHSGMNGSYNAVAPAPVTNKNLMLKLALATRGKFAIPVHVPAVVLKLIMGESSIEVLKSTTASSNKIKASGFIFICPTIDAALKKLLD